MLFSRVSQALAGVGTEHQFSTEENSVVTRFPPTPASIWGSGFSVFRTPAGCGTSQPPPRAKGRGESQGSFDLGSLNPALETLAGLALKVPFLHRLESIIRTPRDSIKAADQNHRFTGFPGESHLLGLQGSLQAVAPCRGESQSLISPPSRLGELESPDCPTAGGKEALRISSRWRKSNPTGPQLTDSHPTSPERRVSPSWMTSTASLTTK